MTVEKHEKPHGLYKPSKSDQVCCVCHMYSQNAVCFRPSQQSVAPVPWLDQGYPLTSPSVSVNLGLSSLHMSYISLGNDVLLGVMGLLYRQWRGIFKFDVVVYVACSGGILHFEHRV